MTAVKSIDIRNNFNTFCDKVFGGETLIISRPKNENVVMISENEYNLLQKAKRNAEYLSMLDRSIEEAKSGNIIVKSLEDFD
ncbi:type II toxin-antitoxin system Phd/YefM family antitoxin [Treponema sp. OMZ 305]|uniref:type II toxin-antitoxin system Phd/YefM family antitoxin n=1 Tax=Treponema sp. OMZ 305 TaxID=1659192 RepID=UPI0020A410B2|nr:type II toxin-antitoxin system Phd/YefM family antitoxin [Treponema sp. OMZ 305]UTC57299.1 type II toxin-antitoxin system Phd/YefM family antitoxin [Treponema sp. OMZ 305]